jgi:hypothetical protein
MNQDSRTSAGVPGTAARAAPLLLGTVIAVLGLAAATMVSLVIYRMVANGGLMPPPATPQRYDCAGPRGPFSLYFLHGQSHVRLQSDTVTLEGRLVNGDLLWAQASTAQARLGFAPPASISYDGTRELRVDGPAFHGLRCLHVPAAGAVPKPPAS